MTAICADPQENLDFYRGVLGLRLVKLTVNFDDPATYHFYYGDGAGNPGSILTFFPYPAGHHGRPGTGQVTLTTLSIRRTSLTFWQDRLKEYRTGGTRDAITFEAPDGLRLRLSVDDKGWEPACFPGSPIPPEHAIAGIHGVTLEEDQLAPTDRIITQVLGFRKVRTDGNIVTYHIPGGPVTQVMTLKVNPNGTKSRTGHGSVHHIAFRTKNEESLAAWRQELHGLGYQVSPIMNRDYFRSIYFREPGGVLFEIATDPPGFTVDEPEDRLGSGLRLPRQYEPYRDRILRALPPVKL